MPHWKPSTAPAGDPTYHVPVDGRNTVMSDLPSERKSPNVGIQTPVALVCADASFEGVLRIPAEL